MAQNRTSKTFTKEFGMALAVLALWMLSLLAPLHQASGVLREMAKAGYDVSGAWSVCLTLSQDENAPKDRVPVCPAHGISKSDIALPPSAVKLTLFLPLSHEVVIPADRLSSVAEKAWRPGRPRAPPARA